MSGEKRLTQLIESVVDGDAVDWEALARSATDEELRALLQHLKTLAGVVRVHAAPSDPGSAAETVEALPLATARRWGRFLLIRKIGEGSFGEVYHARDGLLDHAVALKVLRPHLTDHSRILHEARTLVRVRHPNVVSLYGADTHDNRIGFWMELIEGHTLAEIVESEGVRGASEAAVIGQDLCRALAAVHAQKVIHRDIKARNVMRESGGRVVLMDFGAGEPMQPHATLAVRRLAGTPLYLAPELFEGEPASVASDIYALGVLLFYLVTARFPVQAGEFDELVRAHARGQRAHLGDIRPDLPDAFVNVVERMLAPDPARRYATAGAVHAALDHVISGGHPHPVPKTREEIPGGHSRVLYALAAPIVVLGVLTFAGFVTSTLYNSPLRRMEDFGAETVWTWPVWGLRALVPPAVVMGVLAVIVVALWPLCGLCVRAVPPLRRLCEGVIDRVRKAGARGETASLLAALLFIVQAGALVVWSWYFVEIFRGLDSFISGSSTANLVALQPDNRPLHMWFGLTLYVQVLLFGAAWYGMLRGALRSGERRQIPLAAGGLALTGLMLVLGQVIPYRILYHSRGERVSYQEAQCYIVGQRAGDALLFCPGQPPPWTRIVRSDDPALERAGVFESIFSGVIPDDRGNGGQR